MSLVLPATSANLGPGFDAAALALSLSLKIHGWTAGEFSIQATGRDSEICGRLENHLILTTYREILEAEAKPVVPLALRLDNQIPIGKGCGSSASARLAGIALAVHFGGLRWDDSRVVGEASRREHHPDNAAACWMGGYAVARMSGDSRAQVASITPRGKWPLLLAIPPEPLSTEEARRVLPAQYSRADAVSNIQNSMLLLAAFVEGRRDLLPFALEDRIHQPYRATLCPLLPALQKLAGGSRHSGRGFERRWTVGSDFSRSQGQPRGSESRVASHLRSRGLNAELISTAINKRGANQGNE